MPTAPFQCKDCGRQWTGQEVCHCTACHETFSTEDNFDGHRKHGRCAKPRKVIVGGYRLKAVAGPYGKTWVRDVDRRIA